MANFIQTASSKEARETIFRFRYEVYIDELHKFHLAADHFNKKMEDESDDFSTLYYAENEQGITATVRLQNGMNGNFAKKENEFFSIPVFEKYIHQNQIGITDRLMVKKEYRRSFLTHEIMQALYINAVQCGMQICFISCEESLLKMYFRYGFRMYDAPADIETGDKRYKLVIFVRDRQHLEKMKSPFLSHLPESLDDKGFCANMIQQECGFELIHEKLIQKELIAV